MNCNFYIGVLPPCSHLKAYLQFDCRSLHTKKLRNIKCYNSWSADQSYCSWHEISRCLYPQSPACKDSLSLAVRNFVFRKLERMLFIPDSVLYAERLSLGFWNSNTCLTEHTWGSQPSGLRVSNYIFGHPFSLSHHDSLLEELSMAHTTSESIQSLGPAFLLITSSTCRM